MANGRRLELKPGFLAFRIIESFLKVRKSDNKSKKHFHSYFKSVKSLIGSKHSLQDVTNKSGSLSAIVTQHCLSGKPPEENARLLI